MREEGWERLGDGRDGERGARRDALKWGRSGENRGRVLKMNLIEKNEMCMEGGRESRQRRRDRALETEVI